MKKSRKWALVVLAGVAIATLVGGLYWGHRSAPTLCERSTTGEQFRDVLVSEGLSTACNLQDVQKRLNGFGMEVAPRLDADVLYARADCSSGLLGRRGFFLQARFEGNCVMNIHVEEHDTGP